MKKLKKALSLSLALALSLAMAVPALAAETLTGDQLYGDGWGNGPSITLTGVVGETKTPIDPSYIYDVEVGGSLVLEMTYPAGRNRSYTIMNGGFYIPPDFNPPDDNDSAAWETLGETWAIPASAEGGVFDASSGKTRFVYNFTESDMGQKNGLDKIIYPDIYWCDDVNNDGQIGRDEADGSVYFGIRVVPAKSTTQPEQPTTPTQPERPSQPTTPTTPVTPDAPGSYTVKKGDTWSSICMNYYGTNAQRYNLMKANKSVALKEGTVITLPEKLGKDTLIPAPVAGAGEKLYTVKAGDTLGKIAANQYGKVSEYKAIFERNADRLKNANTIYEGQVIVLPAKK